MMWAIHLSVIGTSGSCGCCGRFATPFECKLSESSLPLIVLGILFYLALAWPVVLKFEDTFGTWNTGHGWDVALQYPRSLAPKSFKDMCPVSLALKVIIKT